MVFKRAQAQTSSKHRLRWLVFRVRDCVLGLFDLKCHTSGITPKVTLSHASSHGEHASVQALDQRCHPPDVTALEAQFNSSAVAGSTLPTLLHLHPAHYGHNAIRLQTPPAL